MIRPVEIIPSINVATFAELADAIRHVEDELFPLPNGPRWVHVDISDASFTPHETWHDPADLEVLNTKMHIELHLMLADIDAKIYQWLSKKIRRAIFHVEAAQRPRDVIHQCHVAHIEAGVAILPETSWDRLVPFIGVAEMLQLLAVQPGPSGQPFEKNVLDKIEYIRALAPGALIEIDGGICEGIARSCVERGANALVSGSVIFSSPSIADAYASLLGDFQS